MPSVDNVRYIVYNIAETTNRSIDAFSGRAR